MVSGCGHAEAESGPEVMEEEEEGDDEEEEEEEEEEEDEEEDEEEEAAGLEALLSGQSLQQVMWIPSWVGVASN